MTTKRSWYDNEEKHPHALLSPVVRELFNSYAAQRQRWLSHVQMYNNVSPEWSSSTVFRSLPGTLSQPWTSRNLIRASVEALTSKIGKIQPRPVIMTDDGQNEDIQRAEKLTQFLDGQLDYMDHYGKARQVFKNTAVMGTNGLHFWVDEGSGEVRSEVLYNDEVVIDPLDCLYGPPSQIHHIRKIPRAAALKAYGKTEAQRMAIQAAPNAFSQGTTLYAQDMIALCTSYKVATQDKPGRKVVWLDAATLHAQEWAFDFLPYEFFHWSKRPYGFWSAGVAEELTGAQLEINHLLQTISQALHLVAVPRVLISQGVRTDVTIDNKVGALIRVPDINALKFITPQALSNEIYAHVKWIVAGALEQVGLNELAMSGQVPAGMEARVAIQALSETTSDRFAAVAQEWEAFHLGSAKKVLALTRASQLSGRKPLVRKSSDSDFMRSISWKEADLDESRFMMRVFGSNILPTTPAARINAVRGLVAEGILTPEDALAKLDFPDIKSIRSSKLASERLIQRTIDLILDGKPVSAPDPYMNLKQARDIGVTRYLQAKLRGVSEAKLYPLLRWLEAVKDLIPSEPQVQAIENETPVPPEGGMNV